MSDEGSPTFAIHPPQSKPSPPAVMPEDLSQTMTEYNFSLFGARAPGPRPAAAKPVKGALGSGTHSATAGSPPARGEDGYVGEVEEDGSFESFGSDEEEVQAEVEGHRAPQAPSVANPGTGTPAAAAAAAAGTPAAPAAAGTAAAAGDSADGNAASPGGIICTVEPDAVKMATCGSRRKTRASTASEAPTAAMERKPVPQQQCVSPPVGPLPPVPDRFKSSDPNLWGIHHPLSSGVVPWTPRRNNTHQPDSRLVKWLCGDKLRKDQATALVHMIPVRASGSMLLDKLKPDLKKQAEEELPKDHRVYMTKGIFSLVHTDSSRWPYNGIHGESGNWVIVAGIVPAPMKMGQDGVLHGRMLVVLQWTGPQEKTPDNSAKDASQRASGAKRGSGGNSSRGGRGKVARMTPGRGGVRELDDLADAAAVADEAGQQGRSWQPQQTQGEGSEGGEEQQMGFDEEMHPLESMVGQQARVGQGAAPSNAGQRHGGRAGGAGSSRPHTARVVEEVHELDALQSAGEGDEQEQGQQQQQQQQQRQHPQQAQHKPLQEEQERAAKRPRAGAQPAASAPPRSGAPSRSDAAAHTGLRRPNDTQTPLREPVARDLFSPPPPAAAAAAAVGLTPAAAATEAMEAVSAGAATRSKHTAPAGAPSGSATPRDLALKYEWPECLKVAALPQNNPSMKVKSLYRRFCDLAERLDELEADIGAARELLEKAKAKQPGLEYYQHENLVHEHERQKLQLQRDMRQLHHEWLDYTT